MYSIILSLSLMLQPAPLPKSTDLGIEGPAQVQQHKLVVLKPFNNDPQAAILWDVYPEENVDIMECNGALIFTAPPGEYRVKLRTVLGKEVRLAKKSVSIMGGSPGPSPPTPVPPGPSPPPSPTTFEASLRAALALEPQDQKGLVVKLAELYTVSAMIGAAQAKTWGQLWDTMASTAKVAGVSGKLVNVQAVISKELSARLPVDPRKTPQAVVEPAHRKLLQDEFVRVAEHLNRLTK